MRSEVPVSPPGEGSVHALDGLEYRTFQREALEYAIDKKVGIIKISTGGGKTPLLAGIVSSLGRPSLVLLPQAPLLQQTAGEFHKWGVPDLGVFGVGKESGRASTPWQTPVSWGGASRKDHGVSSSG